MTTTAAAPRAARKAPRSNASSRDSPIKSSSPPRPSTGSCCSAFGAAAKRSRLAWRPRSNESAGAHRPSAFSTSISIATTASRTSSPSPGSRSIFPGVSWSSSTTCSIPAARFARRSMRSPTSGDPPRSGSAFWSIEVCASFRSSPTTSDALPRRRRGERVKVLLARRGRAVRRDHDHGKLRCEFAVA